MKFQVDQSVVFLREQGGGKILSEEAKGYYRVEDEDGFTRTMHFSELGPVLGEHYIFPEFAEDLSQKEKPLNRKVSKPKQAPEVLEIDLHIEELVDSHAGWSNAQILSRQMISFQNAYLKARRLRKRKLVVIHGVGEGVLRNDVRSWLDQQEGLKYYDADFREYGQGATMVELFYF